ncbi:GNAT family N-acetyltransferase [Nonomuraea sp. NPDC050394]|uniref:GNAT family N-acetyltransferase n=1 Tax=Nonomuraea sp. NPDC050394 TaxID=3364363 RepID=UPI00379100AE
MSGRVWLRAARPDEAGPLSALAMRSKASWGYDEAFLDACREELRLRDVVGRRTVVAERDGGVVGFATLDGDQPHGELGMLFVEPEAIGQGVGGLLYRRVLEEAGRIGFTRLSIASDPHAEGFYLAMGARRHGVSGALPLLVAWPPGPEPASVNAWTGGRAAVHVGNVAEFNRTFSPIPAGGDHYSCLAVFASPRPAVVILPEPVDGAWIRDLADVLGWGEVEVHDGVAADGGVSAAIASRPDLMQCLGRGRVLPWGRTAEFERIVPSAGGVPAAIGRFESKRGAHELFRALAPGHPGILIPRQRPVGSRRELLRELARGEPLVLKTEYGVGGSGTLVVTGATPRIGALARRWAREGGLLEEYVDGSGPFRAPTFDAVIDDAGEVHPVGAGAMVMDGTRYQGVTVGPGVLPAALEETAVRFGGAVGGALAAHGYRGWFDVDYVTGPTGRLAPTEINLRLTGPAAAFCIQARLDRLHGGRHFVRTLDHLPLGARLPPSALRAHVARAAEECRGLGATLLVTVPTAAAEAEPYVGMAIAARTARALDEAEAALRGANEALGAIFTAAARPRRGRARPRRS